jgi:hypothetical protein
MPRLSTTFTAPASSSHPHVTGVGHTIAPWTNASPTSTAATEATRKNMKSPKGISPPKRFTRAAWMAYSKVDETTITEPQRR